jgi:hypothetical protein
MIQTKNRHPIQTLPNKKESTVTKPMERYMVLVAVIAHPRCSRVSVRRPTSYPRCNGQWTPPAYLGYQYTHYCISSTHALLQGRYLAMILPLQCSDRCVHTHRVRIQFRTASWKSFSSSCNPRNIHTALA